MAIIRYRDGVLVQVDEQEARDHEMGVSPIQLMQGFGNVAKELRSRVDQIGAELKSGIFSPDEIEVEFGVELEATAGLPIIAKGSANCHVIVKATWKKTAADPSQT